MKQQDSQSEQKNGAARPEVREIVAGARANVKVETGTVQARMDVGADFKRDLLTAAGITGASLNDLIEAVLRETQHEPGWMELWSRSLHKKAEAARQSAAQATKKRAVG